VCLPLPSLLADSPHSRLAGSPSLGLLQVALREYPTPTAPGRRAARLAPALVQSLWPRRPFLGGRRRRRRGGVGVPGAGR